jgi:uncharacterized protein
VRYVYLDASVLVKAYVQEPGTTEVQALLSDAVAVPARARLVTSRLALAEAVSAVSRREHSGELTREEADVISTRLASDFGGPTRPYVIVEAAAGLVHHAAELVRRHRLRALDAVHLATGLAVRYTTPADATFLFGSADERLSLAAVNEHLPVFDPS